LGLLSTWGLAKIAILSLPEWPWRMVLWTGMLCPCEGIITPNICFIIIRRAQCFERLHKHYPICPFGNLCLKLFQSPSLTQCKHQTPASQTQHLLAHVSPSKSPWATSTPSLPNAPPFQGGCVCDMRQLCAVWCHVCALLPFHLHSVTETPSLIQRGWVRWSAVTQHYLV
jgi:hypothetical protein